MCQCGKTTFTSRKEANDNNKYVGNNTGVWHDVYKCTICGHWHLCSRGKKLKLSVY